MLRDATARVAASACPARLDGGLLSATVGCLGGASRMTGTFGTLRQFANSWSRHRTVVHASRFLRHASRSLLRNVPADRLYCCSA